MGIHGEGDAGGEGDEGHEAREQVREGPVREVRCVPRDEDGGQRWADQGQPDEEQEREDREQEGERERQEGLRPDQGLDRRRAEGAQGSRREGLLRGEEGYAALQEGEGVLRPLSAARSPRRLGRWLRDVGLSRTLCERRAPPLIGPSSVRPPEYT